MLAHLCALICVGCGIGLLSQRKAAPSARVLLAYILLCLLVLVPGLSHGLTVDVYWSLSQTWVLGGGRLGTVRLVRRRLGQAAL